MAANRYQHTVPPEDYKQLLEYIERELAGVSSAVDSIEDGQRDVLSAPPARVFPGMVVYADGTNWNPDGSGREGQYAYTSDDEWVFQLGAKSPIHILGSGSGATNTSYIAFYEEDGVTRKGLVGDVASTDSNVMLAADVGNVEFYAQGATRVQIGSTTMGPMTDGGFPLGVNGLRWSSVGTRNVSFPATQVQSADPNSLDDYEEGTFTPIYTFLTNGDLSVTYSVQSGIYQKVGNHVSIGVLMATTSFTWTTSSGQLRVSGMPFNGGTGVAGCVGLAANLPTGANTSLMCLEAGASNIGLYYHNGATGATTQLQHPQAPSGSNKTLRLSCVYRTTG